MDTIFDGFKQFKEKNMDKYEIIRKLPKTELHNHFSQLVPYEILINFHLHGEYKDLLKMKYSSVDSHGNIKFGQLFSLKIYFSDIPGKAFNWKDFNSLFKKNVSKITDQFVYYRTLGYIFD